MKKFCAFGLVLVCLLAILGCDKETSSIVTEDIHTVDNEAVMALAEAAIADFNDPSDEFSCASYFSPNRTDLLDACSLTPNDFSPDDFDVGEILTTALDPSVTDSILCVVTTETDDPAHQIVFDIGLEFVDTNLYISSWEFEVIENPEMDERMLYVYQFVRKYNDSTIPNTTFCSIYMPNSIEQSNCGSFRTTGFQSGYTMRIIRFRIETYYVFETNMIYGEGPSAVDTYVLAGTPGAFTIRSGYHVFYPTPQFDAETVSFLNNYMNETLDSDEVCQFLDSGRSACESARDGYFDIGISSGSVGDWSFYYDYDGTNLFYFSGWSFSLVDETRVSILVRATVLPGGELEYEILD